MQATEGFDVGFDGERELQRELGSAAVAHESLQGAPLTPQIKALDSEDVSLKSQLQGIKTTEGAGMPLWT